MKKFITLISTLVFVPIAFAADAPNAQDEQMSPFGIGSSASSSRTVEAAQTWAPQMRDIGVQWFRTGGNAGWNGLQTPDGQWHWDNVDPLMAYWDSQGIKYGMLLWGNNAKDAGGLPIKGIDDWKVYVGELAKHIKGRSSGWKSGMSRRISPPRRIRLPITRR